MVGTTSLTGIGAFHPGDTLSPIVGISGTTIGALVAANELSSRTASPQAGRHLVILDLPEPWEAHADIRVHGQACAHFRGNLGSPKCNGNLIGFLHGWSGTCLKACEEQMDHL